MAVPQSVIYLCSGVKLNNRYEHSVYWSKDSNGKQQQHAYFSGKVTHTFTAYTFIRKSWSIKVDASMERARTWNYLFYQNYDGKYYYYFIRDIEYISDNAVELFLEIDVLQTYWFDFNLLSCFVDREHAASDGIGDNTVDEGLELGDLKVIDETEIDLQNMCVLVLSTFNPLTTTEENTDTLLSAKYNNVFSGLGIYAVNLTDWQAWGIKLNQLDGWGKSDGIVSMWMYPQSLVQLASGYTWTDGKVTKEVSGVSSFYKDVARNTKTAGSYTPRNNKLLTYPFNFLYVTNNNGTAATYRFERFGDPSACNFRVLGALSPEGAVRMYPLNYNGVQHNYEEGLVLGDYPTCAWNQDVYKLWLAQNQNTHTLSMVSAGLKIAGGAIAMGASAGVGVVAGAGTLVSGLHEIGSLLAQKKDMEVQPPQAKGVSSSSLSVANGFHTFCIKWKSITPEYAKIIDGFFDMYGYKCNRVKVPNIHARENWTYTKTVGCHISGNFAGDDQTKIESIFNNGITFWVNPESVGNYSLNNNVL